MWNKYAELHHLSNAFTMKYLRPAALWLPYLKQVAFVVVLIPVASRAHFTIVMKACLVSGLPLMTYHPNLVFYMLLGPAILQ